MFKYFKFNFSSIFISNTHFYSLWIIKQGLQNHIYGLISNIKDTYRIIRILCSTKTNQIRINCINYILNPFSIDTIITSSVNIRYSINYRMNYTILISPEMIKDSVIAEILIFLCHPIMRGYYMKFTFLMFFKLFNII